MAKVVTDAAQLAANPAMSEQGSPVFVASQLVM
jgi:hypothetical protein